MEDHKIFMTGLLKIKEGIIDNNMSKVLEGYHLIIGEDIKKVDLSILRESIKNEQQTVQSNRTETKKNGRKSKKNKKEVVVEPIEPVQPEETPAEEQIVEKIIRNKTSDGIERKVTIISSEENPKEKKLNQKKKIAKRIPNKPRTEKPKDTSKDESAGVRFYNNPPRLSA